jgi:hypothetical protein
MFILKVSIDYRDLWGREKKIEREAMSKREKR